MFNAFSHLLIRDLRLALRNRHELANPLIFFVLVVSLFPLAVTPTPDALRAMAPGVIWVSALLAVLLSLDRLFKQDYEDGSLDQLMLSPNPLMILVLAKVLAHWLLTGLPLVLIAPLLGLFMSLPMEAVDVLVYSLLLGTPVLSLVGAIGVSLTVAVNRGGVLLSLIILPLYIPILIFGANAVDVAADGMSVRGQLLFLGAVLALALSLAPLATAIALRITASR
ncbi:ABC transporter involved in cytochrome c biogenesis, CcmB subunit [hydrothermal vent metagenome]|uniref:Heme exporter protein B n=1 Tax=hydrothermal vent metagenome TaxID=652676 RepID=A0A3B0WEK9_9ZZZZ